MLGIRGAGAAVFVELFHLERLIVRAVFTFVHLVTVDFGQVARAGADRLPFAGYSDGLSSELGEADGDHGNDSGATLHSVFPRQMMKI